MKISIILPVYNVEKYLCNCLDSCVKQKDAVLNKDYEIICINDGSTDGSSDILKQYEELYDIKVFSYDNGGLSVARNRGTNLASGDYIWWIDSDDYIAGDAICQLIKVTQKYPSDFYRFYWDRVEEDEYREQLCGDMIPCDRKDWNQGKATNYVWTYLLKRQEVKNKGLIFEEGVIFEDTIWQTCFWAKGLQPLFFNNVLYFYRKRSGSITQSRNRELYMKSMMRMQKVYGELLNNEDVGQDLKPQLRNMYKCMTGNILYAELTLQKYSSQKLIAEYKQKGLYPYPIEWSSLRGGAKIGAHTFLINFLKLFFPIEYYYRFVHFLFSLKYKR